MASTVHTVKCFRQVKKTLQEVLTLPVLRSLAGAGTFRRGQEYFEFGYVHDVFYSKKGAFVTACVSGTNEYDVELGIKRDDLLSYCSCPHFADGFFCKHLVALGLECMAEPVKAAAPLAKATSRAREESKSRPPESGDIVQVQKLIEKFVTPMDFGSQAGEAGDRLLGVLGDLRAAGRSDEALRLVDLVFDRIGLRRQLSKSVSRVVTRLADLHFKLASEVPQNPQALAERLIHVETWYGKQYLDDAARRYAELLGKKGLAAYRKALQKRILGLEVLKRGQGQSWVDSTPYEAVCRVAKNLADFQSDPRIYVTALSRDLRDARRLATLSRVCREANVMKEAWRWAKLALQEFPYSLESYEAIAECHLADGHEDLALNALFSELTAHPGLSNYQLVRKYALRFELWQQYVDKSLELLKEYSIRSGWSSEYVNACLLEHRPLDALAFTDEVDFLESGSVHRLGQVLEAEHPQEAIELYLDQIDGLVEQTNGGAYEKAISWLRKALLVLRKMKDSRTIKLVVEDLKDRFKRKKGFTSRLDDLVREMDLAVVVGGTLRAEDVDG
jgi:hypothetical protein